MRDIDKIIIHCSFTTLEMKTTVKDVKHWHVDDNGWSDIGYHIFIDVNGNTFTGRPITKMGAGVSGHNKGSIHICYSGGATRNKDGSLNFIDTRTESQKEALIDMIKYYKIQFPKAIIYGHNNFANKACPCFDAKKEYREISNMFNHLVK